jgi:DNA-binding IclR family transcriptional regulator
LRIATEKPPIIILSGVAKDTAYGLLDTLQAAGALARVGSAD